MNPPRVPLLIGLNRGIPYNPHHFQVTLAPGTRLGAYEVVSLLGEGGMGEVYRARDTKLNRDVALKILPDVFAIDSDRIARSRREAQVLASLNHPNIAAIYGFEDSGSTHALVLELVEGPTLADRIAKGSIPLDEAIPIAKQIAKALEAAHEQGVIHRDLKPSNIKVRPEGTVKVLDFGLAKALNTSNTTPPHVTQAPTITTPAMTQTGLILGTAAYMSPEQARGKPVDKRADIWSFGCVVYEMLSGSRTFGGVDATETIAAIIRSEPDWSLLSAGTPPGILRVLHRCLTKDVERRFADIRDVRLDIDDALVETTFEPTPRSLPARAPVTWLAACLLSAVAAWALTTWLERRASIAAPPEMRVEITTPPTNDLVSLALSPDGQKLVFVASSDRRPKLWLRSLITGSTEALSNTDGATFPFWSPDSRSIGFFANGNLYRIDVDGGSPRALAVAPVGAGGTWNRNGDILFTLVPDASLSRVSAGGGASERLPESQTGGLQETGQRFPQFLPDGRHFLYYVAEIPVRGVYVGNLDSPVRQRLFDADAAAVFVPPDRVLFIRAGKLYGQRFDPTKLQLGGSAAAIAQGVSVDAFGVAAISGSATGTIVFRLGSANRQRQFVWFDRSGAQVGVAAAADADSPLNPAMSPDGRLVALSRSTGGNVDIWLLDLGRRVLSRFTSDPRPEIYPVWSPDGTRIAYAKPNRSGTGFNLYQRTTAGTGEEVALLESSQNMVPEDWSRDGRFLSYITSDSAGRWDLGVLPVGGTSKPIRVTKTLYNEMGSQFSSDGHWIAFESDESGRNEIYVQPFPGPGAKTIVSTGGGLQPHWRRDGQELFYVAPDGKLMAVAMHVLPGGRTLEPSSPIPLFVTRISSTRTGGSRHEYVVAADGQRFLMNTFVEQNAAPITLVLNAATPKD